MARKLKTFLTASGFFESAVAAPSMKAALDIWGNKTNLFQQGFAKETDDPEIVKAAMAAPGVVLRRPVGSKGAFKQDADAPKLSALEKAVPSRSKGAPPPKKRKPLAKEKEKKKSDGVTAHRKAAELYDLAQKRREKEEQREEGRRQKEQERRKQAVEKARAALDAARERHAERVSEIEAEREKIDRKLRLERERWEDEKDKLEAAIRRAGE